MAASTACSNSNLENLVDQLACTTITDVEMSDDSGSNTPPQAPNIMYRDLDGVGDDDQAKASDEDFDDDEADMSSEDELINYDDEDGEDEEFAQDASEEADRDTDVPSLHPTLPPQPAPIDEVRYYYNEHNKRLAPEHVCRLSALLQTPAGMRIFSLYNTWLSCSGWDLLRFPVPAPGHDLEVLSLAMAVEIDNRWFLRNKKENMDVWGNGVLGTWKDVGNGVQRVGTLPPMSPEGHPFHPFWLPVSEEE